MKSHLKIKIKSLAAEAQIIRHAERKLSKRRAKLVAKQGLEARVQAIDEEHSSLYLHRINDVRTEQRSAQIAYSYLRGRHGYRAVEAGEPKSTPDLRRIVELVAKYGGHDKKLMEEPVKAWLEAA